MCFATTTKRYRAVKGVGQIKMCVGVNAYNQLMLVYQTREYFLPEKVVIPMADEAVNTYMNAPLASADDAVLPPDVRHMKSFGRVKFQPCEVCPKNFIIFDQTDQQSRIMFHPAMTYKIDTPAFNVHATCTQDFERKKVNQMERDLSSPFEEDSNDIDALLSLEVDELEDLDEEEVSTARTQNDGSTSDTCSSYCSKSTKKRLSSSRAQKSSGTSSYGDNERKHQEMKRMVNMLRRIVPGGDNQMDAVAVLDEAVNYLKSLKVEVEQFGVAP